MFGETRDLLGLPSISLVSSVACCWCVTREEGRFRSFSACSCSIRIVYKAACLVACLLACPMESAAVVVLYSGPVLHRATIMGEVNLSFFFE